MTGRQDEILYMLRSRGSLSAATLALYAGVSTPVLRRNIQSLRRKGYNIVASLPNSRTNRYTLHETTIADATGDSTSVGV